MVVGTASMARKLSSDIPQLSVPAPVIDRLESDPRAGIDVACEQIAEIRASGVLDGVHLIPIGAGETTALDRC
jgi:methylenetetrahydrofolate reductase (NADPH)